MFVLLQINVVFMCFAVRALWKSTRHDFPYKDKEADNWKLAKYIMQGDTLYYICAEKNV